jgi:DNA-binding FadR family transcriptional regulator
MSSYHKKIAKKIEDKDAGGARRVMVAHLVDMRQMLARYALEDVLK